MSVVTPVTTALQSWLAAMPEFEAERVVVGDIRPLSPDDAGWKQGKPACCIWRDSSLLSQAGEGAGVGGTPLGTGRIQTGDIRLMIQTTMLFDASAARVTTWVALLEALEVRLCHLGWVSGNWFNITIGMGAEPLRWVKSVTSMWEREIPEYTGLEYWIRVGLKKVI